MSPEERLLFETNTHFKDILRVRVNDEKAKVIGMKVRSRLLPFLFIQAFRRKNESKRIYSSPIM